MQVSHPFDPMDPFCFQQQLSDQEQALQTHAFNFAHQHLAPNVTAHFRQEQDPSLLIKAMGAAHLLGGDIPADFGGPQHSATEYGLINRELERVDSGYRTLQSIMSALVMQAIYSFGNTTQHQTYLPALARGDCIGSFALTEPESGSNPAALATQVRRTPQGLIMNGHKRWAGLAPIADLLLIWAKDDNNIIRGYLVDPNTSGITIRSIAGKIGLRTAPQGDITLSNVPIEPQNVLENSHGLASVFQCLNHARFGIAWGVMGAAEDCWHRALDYAQQRHAFDRPLAATQLIQEKLVDMQTRIAFSLQACLRVSRLIEQGHASPEMISILKRDCTQHALTVARNARDLFGGNGILDEYAVMRHASNLEAVNTYEGTHDIHTLILGRALTQHNAF